MKEADMLILRLNEAWLHLDTVEITTPELSPEIKKAITETKGVLIDTLAVLAHFHEMVNELNRQRPKQS
ncbi:MAG TPA: hypothetical protein VFM05_08235 [Candidatus Saccharimonadales bacterium]|jgi:hypothetical protein|nr:hypothetical protein [Candidatus Saccharimonadales bacterium]